MDKIMLMMALISPVFVTAATTASPSACYRGWRYWGGSCYKVFQGATQSTWNTSQTTCHENGGSLVEISERSEQDFVLTLVSAPAEMWIGIYQEESGDWKWLSGNTPMVSYFPAFSMANRSSAPQCGALSSANNGRFEVRKCDNRLHFACEAHPVDCSALRDWHHCLWFSNADGSWPDTRETCHKFQTDLASFSNPSEASILKTKLRPLVSYWVGIQFRPPLSDPIWLDGIRETDSTRFPILYGASPGKAGVYCGCVRLAYHGSLEWGLDDCTYTKPFICARTVREDNKTTKHTAATSQRTSSYTPTITQGTAATKTTDTPPAAAATTSAQLASSSSTTSTTAVTGNPTSAITVTGNPTSAITVTGNPTSAITVTGNPTSAKYPKALTLPTHMTTTTVHPQAHHVTQHTITPDVVGVITVTSGTTHKPHQPQLQMRPRSRKRRRLPAHIHLLLPAHVRIRRTRHCHPDSLHVHAQACCFNGASLSCVTSSRLIFACPPPYPRCIAAFHNPVTSTPAVAHAQTLTTTNTFSAATTALHSSSPTGAPSTTHVNSMQSTMTSKETPKRRVSSTFLSPAFQGNMHFDQNEGLALCSESDQPLDCLLVHIQDGDLKPKVTYHALLRLFRDLRISMTISHSQQTKTNFENFFRILNFFIEGSYSQHWNKYNMSLCDVISIVEVFLNSNIHHLPLSDVISRTYSHIEILIKRIPRNMMKHFHYRDKNGLGKITHIRPTAPLNTSFNDDVVVAVVLMKVPVLQVALVDSNDSGLVLSPVLSLTAYSRERHVSLTHTFNLLHTKSGDQFRITEMEEGGQPMQCVFWDNSSRAWSTYGCTMTSSNNLTSQCYCNHTTNFAILMQINDFELAASDKLALGVITYIGCSVALITQVFAITIYTFVGSLNTERVYMYVHRNLCIAIVCAQVTFLAGIDAVQHRLVCAAVALVLHYCYTAVFVWMLVEGLHLYSKVVQVFGTERSRMIYYMTFGWGVPVILVTISAAADWEGYGTEHSCWLSTSRKTIWTFVGPALAIIIVNMVILAVVIRIVISSSKLEKHGEYDHIRAGIKGALFLLPLLGLTWVFGLAAVNQRLVVFQYLFAIFNSLQGFFISMFHCAFNGEVRQALRRLREKRSLRRGDLSSGSQSTGSQMSDTWAVRSNRSYPAFQHNQVAPLATMATTTTRLNSPSQLKELADGNHGDPEREREELSLMYI